MPFISFSFLAQFGRALIKNELPLLPLAYLKWMRPRQLIYRTDFEHFMAHRARQNAKLFISAVAAASIALLTLR